MIDRARLARLPLLIAALVSLLLAGWLGLARIGWRIPSGLPITMHGPLMICGFLGTLISLERAVALQKGWGYISPVLCALGSVMLLVGQAQIAAALITASSLAFAVNSMVITNRHRALYSVILSLGGLVWLAGNGLWLARWPISRVAHWWAAFLILTIAGERLELARLVRITSRARFLLVGILSGVVGGLVLLLFEPQIGVRVVGSAYVLLAGWLYVYDIARRTVRTSGLPRYVAICLLTGYAWLALGGGIMLAAGAEAAGLLYDALLHALLVGFIMSMLFGHAPIIFPALLQQQIAYFPVLYAPLTLLHASILLRFSADLLMVPGLRKWGGLLNGVAILLFFGLMAYSLRAGEATFTKSASPR